MIEIRPLKREDAESVSAMEREIFSDPWSYESVEDIIVRAEEKSMPHYGAFGAFYDGKPVGYLFSMAVAGEGELHRIAVLPECRKERIGSRLMQRFFEWLKEQNCEASYLEVREGNEAAVALYKKYGFTECGRRKAYYRNPTEDALIFACQEFPLFS